MKIKDIISEENWVQGAWALDEGGCRVGSLSERACKWCLDGFIKHVYRKDYKQQQLVLDRVVDFLDENYEINDIPTWNDSELTKFEDVKELVEKLDI